MLKKQIPGTLTQLPIPGCLQAISTTGSHFPVGNAATALCSSCGQTGIYGLDLCYPAIAWGEAGGKGLWTKVVQQPAPGAFQIYHFLLVHSYLVGDWKNNWAAAQGFKQPLCVRERAAPGHRDSPWEQPLVSDTRGNSLVTGASRSAASALWVTSDVPCKYGPLLTFLCPSVALALILM